MAPPAAAARSNRKPKTDRIDVRIPRETKRVIERAAALIGTTTSDFITMQAYEAAQRVVEGQGRWVLDAAQSKAFVETLINPPEPNAALKAAAKRYKALVRSDAG